MRAVLTACLLAGVSLAPASAQMPTQMPTQMLAQAPTQMLAQASTQAPAQMPTQMPARTPTWTLARTPVQIPARTPAQMLAQASTQAPAQAPAQALTQTLIQAPTWMSARAPAQAPTQVPKRVITIGGALTEIVYALGAQSLLVGNDTTSYYPPAADKLPKVGYQRALSAEGILSLAPELVILTEEAGLPAVLEQLRSANIPLLELQAARSLEGIRRNIAAIAEVLDREQAAQALLEKIAAESAVLHRLVQRQTQRKRVMFILQHGAGAPLVAGGGTAADSIIRLAGAANAVHDYQGYKPLTPEAAVALQPDIILITEQGLEQAGGREALLKAPGISLTPAARQGRIVTMDSLLILGFGPRTAAAARELHIACQK